MFISEKPWKNEKKILDFEIKTFEFVAGNSPYCEENTSHWHSMC